jgi:pimeloyl-ACP methyl ester carboxylesterase
MTSAKQHFITTNGLSLSVTEQGQGPLVLLCHGFPETSQAWRHQLPALTEAGFRAVAPDLRGYGLSDRPADAAKYSALDILGDLVGLLDALGESQAVIVGSDWGATMAWQAARLRPDRFRAVAVLGVPMMGRAPAAPSKMFPLLADSWFYVHYFIAQGLAERELEADVVKSLRRIYHAASGDAGPRDDPSTPNPFGMVTKSQGLLGGLPEPTSLPRWLSANSFDALVKAYETSGFTGGLNYYRNLDRNWELDAAFQGLRVEVPALYMVGERDTGLAMPGMQDIIAGMSEMVPNLKASIKVPGAGHWLSQEAPDEVNEALTGFLLAL